jgi:hypothetical protein
MDTYQGTVFHDPTAELTDIQSSSPSIDLTDWALLPDLTGPFSTSSNYRITTQASGGFAEIEFMLANNFWGVPFDYGFNPHGTEVRQGVAHLIDKALFAANEVFLSGQAEATDTPEPSDSHGLPSANPACGMQVSRSQAPPAK